MEIQLRPAQPEDVEACGRICFEAFTAINQAHNFPPDFPNPDLAIQVLRMLMEHPRHYVVVAESAGRIVGSNAVDERGSIAGIGPITVDPSRQNGGVGRALMEHVIERSWQRGSAGIRLVQAAFHNRSLSLYTKIGFDPREPLSVMQGPPIRGKIEGYEVRAATAGDVPACSRLCRSVHGHDREGELRDAISQGTARVVERGGQIGGYARASAFFSHAVADGDAALQALIADAAAFPGPGFLVPTRNATLMRWCLENGLRVVEPMTLMTMGLYNEPRGSYLPSISY